MELRHLKKSIIKDFITKKIATDDKWAIRTLRLLYASQTESERSGNKSLAINKRGFSRNDAEVLTPLAKQSILTDDQMKLIHEILPKYWKQVYRASLKQKLLKLIISSFPGEQQELKF